jgi:hypothetical protein
MRPLDAISALVAVVLGAVGLLLLDRLWLKALGPRKALLGGAVLGLLVQTGERFSGAS